MKNFKLTTYFILSFLIFSLNSCENEPLDSGFDIGNGNTQGNTDGDTDGNTDDDSNSTGDYWPRAIGNTWTYNALSGEEEVYNMIETEMFNGDEYYAYDSFLGLPTWLRKQGVNYYVRNEVFYSIPGYDVQSTPFVVNMLKDDAEVGESWSSDINYTISFIATAGSPEIPDTSVSATYSFEMIGRDLSRTVEGNTYENVLHVNLTVSALGQNETADYYYAKDVGMIEYVSNGGSVTLIDYTLN
ncbi:hypothetical protein [Hanstruepera flava]|uniref:hypothetical protein n=1 Tax=Hanstruepera flava TaxID=2930218 RepID=UPI0020278ACB|nr:hypothetical protein [Hanstruepera flava]